ncbi:MAG: prepilin-type N-terminal cleavage/methylation domain-containing protein [Candidatus Sumerlaeaceae bacterium]
MRQYRSLLSRGFTLIELLIVVAIIAVLAAIAVPNFLEAQVRAKTSRVKADLRSVATAVEAYVVDANDYPPGCRGDLLHNLFRITTPISYITSVAMTDPFKPLSLNTVSVTQSYVWYNYKGDAMYVANPELGELVAEAQAAYGNATNAPAMYLLSSFGPDRVFDRLVAASCEASQGNHALVPNHFYDPTNGTVSSGDLGRYGGIYPPVVARYAGH